MKVNNIKDFDKLVNTYGDIEKLILESKKQISLESTCNFITNEILKDLVYDIELKSKMLENYTVEFMDISSIITESHIKIKKAHRNKDIELVEGLLNDLLINVINKRKDVVYRGDSLMESYVDNVQMIYDSNIERLNSKVIGLTEAINKKNNSIINTIRNAFASKHDKLVTRDKQWLKDNKKKLTSMSYDGVELEVPSDYKVTFANLINKHDIFDKNFRSGGSPEDIQNSIRRFEDKSGNLKNGLDNYFRTGSARREIGLRKVSGEEAKNVVSAMIDYCNDFLSGKKFIEDKLDELNNEANKTNESKEESSDEVVKEYSSYLYLKDNNGELLSPYKGFSILEENGVTNAVKDAWNKVLYLDGKLTQVINGGVLGKNFILSKASAKTSVKMACSILDIKFLRRQNDIIIKKLSTVANKNPGKNKELEDYIKWLKNDYNRMIDEKEVKLKTKNKKIFGESVIYEADESNKDEKQNSKNNNNDDDDWGLEDDPIDDIDTEDNKEEVENNKEDDKKQEEKKEEKPSEEVVDSAKIARDRQTGITVLMTIAEERYFDYIDILKSLLEE